MVMALLCPTLPAEGQKLPAGYGKNLVTTHAAAAPSPGGFAELVSADRDPLTIPGTYAERP
jgi:hypothetical protein